MNGLGTVLSGLSEIIPGGIAHSTSQGTTSVGGATADNLHRLQTHLKQKSREIETVPIVSVKETKKMNAERSIVNKHHKGGSSRGICTKWILKWKQLSMEEQVL